MRLVLFCFLLLCRFLGLFLLLLTILPPFSLLQQTQIRKRGHVATLPAESALYDDMIVLVNTVFGIEHPRQLPPRIKMVCLFRLLFILSPLSYPSLNRRDLSSPLLLSHYIQEFNLGSSLSLARFSLIVVGHILLDYLSFAGSITLLGWMNQCMCSFFALSLCCVLTSHPFLWSSL
jgi:hypothetical protein